MRHWPRRSSISAAIRVAAGSTLMPGTTFTVQATLPQEPSIGQRLVGTGGRARLTLMCKLWAAFSMRESNRSMGQTYGPFQAPIQLHRSYWPWSAAGITNDGVPSYFPKHRNLVALTLTCTTFGALPSRVKLQLRQARGLVFTGYRLKPVPAGRLLAMRIPS
jgi:hypothetical protein